MDSNAKVLIGIPTTDFGAHIHWSISLAALTRATPFPLGMATGRGSNIPQNRNHIVEVAKQNKVEFLLFIDNDLSFPQDAAIRLVAQAENNDLDILGCNYLVKTPPHRSMMALKSTDEGLTGLDEVLALPTGMMLVRMSVFEKLRAPYFLYAPMQDPRGFESVGTEDAYFCAIAREAGIKIWMDGNLSLALVHWGTPFGVQWSLEPPGYRYHTSPPNYGESLVA
jgi:hypothetical protein